MHVNVDTVDDGDMSVCSSNGSSSGSGSSGSGSSNDSCDDDIRRASYIASANWIYCVNQSGRAGDASLKKQHTKEQDYRVKRGGLVVVV